MFILNYIFFRVKVPFKQFARKWSGRVLLTHEPSMLIIMMLLLLLMMMMMIHCTASDRGRFKSVCCVPYFLIAFLVVVCLAAALVLMSVFGFRSFGSTSASPPADYTVINSVLIALGSVIGVVLLANLYTWMRAVVHLAVPTRKQVCVICVSLLEVSKLRS